LDSEQAFSIQFSGIDEGSAKELMAEPDLPQHIRSFVVQFENDMTQAEFDDLRFSYRVAFVRKTSNSKTIADKVIQFVLPGTDAATEINRVFLKETEKAKFRPSTIVKQMKAEGYTKFGIAQHTDLWKEKNAKNPKYHSDRTFKGAAAQRVRDRATSSARDEIDDLAAQSAFPFPAWLLTAPSNGSFGEISLKPGSVQAIARSAKGFSSSSYPPPERLIPLTGGPFESRLRTLGRERFSSGVASDGVAQQQIFVAPRRPQTLAQCGFCGWDRN
jgi:hypothetical protein